MTNFVDLLNQKSEDTIQIKSELPRMILFVIDSATQFISVMDLCRLIMHRKRRNKLQMEILIITYNNQDLVGR